MDFSYVFKSFLTVNSTANLTVEPNSPLLHHTYTSAMMFGHSSQSSIVSKRVITWFSHVSSIPVTVFF